VVKSEVVPRQEIVDTDSLVGVMLFIRLLENNNLKVLVGFTSSDILLWKAAGATSCATGKFWNLRRFTPSRWDPNDGGGGQIAYWFEEALLAAVRETDVLRLIRDEPSLFSDASNRNPFSKDILERLSQRKRIAWIGVGWRQYLYWFADVEERLTAVSADAEQLLTL
jgi:hypothetical protein